MSPKNFYRLEPDHFDELGEHAEYDTSKPFGEEMGHLHIHLRFPMEADLHQGYGVFVISSPLERTLREHKIYSYELTQCELTWEAELSAYYPELFPLPQFHRLRPTGAPMADDVALDDGRLVVSDRFIEALNAHRYNHCETEVLSGGEAAEKLIEERRKSYR